MNVIRDPAELRHGNRKISLAIGVFDGVHLGHQQVLRQAASDAHQHEGLAVAITFDRHPNSVVAPDRTPELVYSLDQKLRAIGAMGITSIYLIAFDRSFSEIPAEQFIRSLVREFRSICSICVGSGFTFGFRRGGNVDLLTRLGAELNFGVHGLAAVALDGKTVSSTRIREAIKEGQLDAASQMLGREYALAGTVMAGDQLGRRLGFPTANVSEAGLVLPPFGVYAAHAEVRGATHRAVVNIGRRPTLRRAEPERRVEAHLLDFDGELYGEEMELSLICRLRGEEAFASIDLLKRQIGADVERARKFFDDGD